MSTSALASPLKTLARVAGGAALIATVAWTPPPDVVPVARFALSNGLVAVVSQDRATPNVSVDVWYHVGSRDDPAGRNGMAHLVEHVIADGGSHNVPPREHQRIIVGAGGAGDGWAGTHEDFTEYHETVPASYLETVLWLESDRLATVEGAITDSTLSAAKSAVTLEWINDLKSAASVATALTPPLLFPAPSPYHLWPVGTPRELTPVTTTEVKAFIHDHYTTDRAVVAIAGDVDPETAHALVQKYFGSIPRVAAATRPAIPAPVATEVRAVLQDSMVTTPQLRIDWPGANVRSEDREALEILASILSADRTSLLPSALVFSDSLATSVSARHADLEEGGVFEINAALRPGRTLTQIEDRIDSVVALVTTTPRSEREIDKALARRRVSLAVSAQGTVARASELEQGEFFHGDARATINEIMSPPKITAADVQRVAKKYLGRARVVMSVVPQGLLMMASKPELPYQLISVSQVYK